MTTLHLVRHGQSLWNAEIRIQGSSDPALSTLGIEQAKQVGATLPSFDRVYSSDLLRTRQTTEHILGGDIVRVDFRASLREIHLGPWEGMLLTDATEQYPAEADQFRNRPSEFSLTGAESFHELQARAINAINDIVEECNGADINVLVVSHGAFLKSALIEYDDRSLNEIWQHPHINNCGHSIVRYANGKATIVKFADHDSW